MHPVGPRGAAFALEDQLPEDPVHAAPMSDCASCAAISPATSADDRLPSIAGRVGDLWAARYAGHYRFQAIAAIPAPIALARPLGGDRSFQAHGQHQPGMPKHKLDLLVSQGRRFCPAQITLKRR